MKTNQEKNQQSKRILARVMSKDLSEEQLKKVAAAGTCSLGNDADLSEV